MPREYIDPPEPIDHNQCSTCTTPCTCDEAYDRHIEHITESIDWDN